MSYPLTIVAVGDHSSRKTELLIKYTGCEERYEASTTSGYLNVVEEIIVDRRPYLVHFIDTPCGDSYKQLRRSFVEKADCVLLCYSIQSRGSFETLTRKWCIEVRRASPRVPIILVGTGAELRRLNKENWVSWEEGCDLKCLTGARALVECSLDNFQGVDDVFIAAVRSTY